MAATATNYGSDSYCLDDLQRISTEVTEPRLVIGQRVARRLQTPRGALGLIGGDPDFGYDVRQLILSKLSPAALSTARSQIQAEVLKDAEVLSCSVRLTPQVNNLVISINIVASDGPFSLVLNVRDLTVEAVFSFQGEV